MTDTVSGIQVLVCAGGMLDTVLEQRWRRCAWRKSCTLQPQTPLEHTRGAAARRVQTVVTFSDGRVLRIGNSAEKLAAHPVAPNPLKP